MYYIIYQATDSTKHSYCIYIDFDYYDKKIAAIQKDNNLDQTQKDNKIFALEKHLSFTYSPGTCQKIVSPLEKIYNNQDTKAQMASDQATVTNLASNLAYGLASGFATVIQATSTKEGTVKLDNGTFAIPLGTMVKFDATAGTFCVSKGGYKSSDTSGGTVKGSC
jgi:hypothetical protein